MVFFLNILLSITIIGLNINSMFSLIVENRINYKNIKWESPAVSTKFNDLASQPKYDMKLYSTPRSSRDQNQRKYLSIIEKIIFKNPIAYIISNIYSFFYWSPRLNMPYDTPWDWLTNSSSQFIAYYQFPHNLPPYEYLGEGYPSDFFCFGFPGNTLPLGNWDPLGFQLVQKKVVKKYRESELKHGRLAMLATCGCMVQELYHPLYPTIGGLAVTHMQQYSELSGEESIISRASVALGISYPSLVFPSDYILFIIFLCTFEIFALVRNWWRWRDDEYHHPFDHNIGIANLREDYDNGNYGFDPLNLSPKDPREYRIMLEKELNNGRLAMVAFIGMLGQEYLTGESILTPVLRILQENGVVSWGEGAVSAGEEGGELFLYLLDYLNYLLSQVKALLPS